MITAEPLPSDEVFIEFSGRLSTMGTNERQKLVRELLESMADWTQGTLEEEVYLRALRAMRKR